MAKTSVGKNIATGAIDFMNGLTNGSGGFKTNKAINQLPKTIKASSSLRPMATKGSKALSKNLKSKNVANITQSGSAKVGNFLGKGTRASYQNMKNGSNFADAVKKGHSTNGKLDYKKIAGTGAALGVAGRVATGGGVYRDRYGNVNAPGIPFI